MNGWTPTLPKINRLENWRKSCIGILQDDPQNTYWQNSLEEAERQIDAWFEEEYAEEIAQGKDWRTQQREERP